MAFQRRANPPCTPRCVPRAPSSPPSAWPGPLPARESGTLRIRTLVPPRCPSGRLQRQAAPRVRAAGAHLLRLWLDRLRLCSSLRLGDLRAPGHPGSKPWDGWDVAQAEGPLTLVTRREAKQNQRTLGAATFFSPAGFCVGRAKPGQRSPCHEACPGLGQRLHAACGRTLAFGTLGLVAFGFFSPAACARRASLWVAWRATSQQRVCRAPQPPPRVQRPELAAVSAYAGAGQGRGRAGRPRAGRAAGRMWINCKPGAHRLGRLGLLGRRLLLELLPKLPARLHLRGRAGGDSSPGLLTSGTAL